jgi:hypothetical protein
VSEYISRAPVATISISTRFLGDTRLSLHAFRVAAFILGQDPDRPFVKARLAQALGIGRSTLDKALTELADFGYRTSEGHITDQPVLSQDTVPGVSPEERPELRHRPEPGHSADESVLSQDTPGVQAPIAGAVLADAPARAGAVTRNRAISSNKKEDVLTHTSGQEEVCGTKKDLPIAAETSPTETLSRPKKPKARNAYTEDFELAWEGYGRQGGKRPAFVAWEKALANGATVETILTGIMSYLESERVQRGYKKDMSTFLNEEGWESDWTPAKPKQSKVEQIEEEMAKGDFRHVGNREYIQSKIDKMTHEEKIKYGVIRP